MSATKWERARKAWLKERQNGMGGSDAAAILGLSPYMTSERLWEIKTGRVVPEDIGDKPYVKYGNDAEAHIRALWALDNPDMAVGYEEFRIIRNAEHPFIFATLDGDLTDASGRRGVWECKTTEIFRGDQWGEWTGKVPQHYYAQVLWQLLATGFDFAVLTARMKYTDRNGKKKATTQDYRFERADLSEDLGYLLREAIEFWDMVQRDERPALKLPQI